MARNRMTFTPDQARSHRSASGRGRSDCWPVLLLVLCMGCVTPKPSHCPDTSSGPVLRPDPGVFRMVAGYAFEGLRRGLDIRQPLLAQNRTQFVELWSQLALPGEAPQVNFETFLVLAFSRTGCGVRSEVHSLVQSHHLLMPRFVGPKYCSDTAKQALHVIQVARSQLPRRFEFAVPEDTTMGCSISVKLVASQTVPKANRVPVAATPRTAVGEGPRAQQAAAIGPPLLSTPKPGPGDARMVLLPDGYPIWLTEELDGSVYALDPRVAPEPPWPGLDGVTAMVGVWNKQLGRLSERWDSRGTAVYLTDESLTRFAVAPDPDNLGHVMIGSRLPLTNDGWPEPLRAAQGDDAVAPRWLTGADAPRDTLCSQSGRFVYFAGGLYSDEQRTCALTALELRSVVVGSPCPKAALTVTGLPPVNIAGVEGTGVWGRVTAQCALDDVAVRLWSPFDSQQGRWRRASSAAR